jgi:twinkle protein
MKTTESTFVDHHPCPSCGSSDANALYSDGHYSCFSCGAYTAPGDTVPVPSPGKAKKRPELITDGEVQALKARKISEETCRKFGYTVASHFGNRVQVAPYYDRDGHLVGQKIRGKDKKFAWYGDMKDALPFGAQAFPQTGKKIVVTEGEVDAMSMSQVQQNKWPVVSIGCGAGPQIRRYFAERLDYFNGFDEVVIMFDQDEAGRQAAETAASVLGGRAKIAVLPRKDPNEMLVAGEVGELVTAMWNAKPYRPEGIMSISETKDAVLAPTEWGLSWPFETLTNLTFGMRLGELYAIGAGTGIGKSDLLAETVVHLVQEHKQTVGYFALEQTPTETALRLVGKLIDKPIHKPDVEKDPAEIDRAYRVLGDKVHLYDSFGANDYESIKEKIEFLAHAYDVKYFFLDHLTALAANEEDERKGLDSIMADLGALVKRLNVCLTFVSHLATPHGTPHEEGGRVWLRHFRGSRTIAAWSHYAFGLERNQQSDDPIERRTTTFRVLKDRFTGAAAGEKFHFTYDHETGRLYECPPAEEQADYGFEDQSEDGESTSF